MISLNTLITFAMTAFIVTLIPGPDNIYVLSRGITQGRKVALMATLGLSLGVIIHTTLAVAGLSALLQSSAVAFQFIKYAGVAYLLYLGVKTLLSKSSFAIGKQWQMEKAYYVFWQSVLMNLLNPKVTLFFLAFLPQFIDLKRGYIAVQMLFLGILFMANTLLVFGLIAYFSGTVGNWLRQKPRFANRLKLITGCVFIFLAAKLALP
jgi:threonine/homoserine/homoserine lactone efflux protein